MKSHSIGLKTGFNILQNGLVISASPTCRPCKSDLQALQVGLANIADRICKEIKRSFTLAKRRFSIIKRRFNFLKRRVIFMKTNSPESYLINSQGCFCCVTILGLSFLYHSFYIQFECKGKVSKYEYCVYQNP